MKTTYLNAFVILRMNVKLGIIHGNKRYIDVYIYSTGWQNRERIYALRVGTE